MLQVSISKICNLQDLLLLTVLDGKSTGMKYSFFKSRNCQYRFEIIAFVIVYYFLRFHRSRILDRFRMLLAHFILFTPIILRIYFLLNIWIIYVLKVTSNQSK